MCDGCGCSAELERRMLEARIKEGTTISFEYERLPTLEAVRKQIHECEGRHVQQAIFSTFMDTLTQICFTCNKVRSTIYWDGARSWTG